MVLYKVHIRVLSKNSFLLFIHRKHVSLSLAILLNKASGFTPYFHYIYKDKSMGFQAPLPLDKFYNTSNFKSFYDQEQLLDSNQLL